MQRTILLCLNIVLEIMNSSWRLLHAKNNCLAVQQHLWDKELISSPSTCKEQLSCSATTSLRQRTHQVAFYMKKNYSLLWCNKILEIMNSSSRLQQRRNNSPVVQQHVLDNDVIKSSSTWKNNSLVKQQHLWDNELMKSASTCQVQHSCGATTSLR